MSEPKPTGINKVWGETGTVVAPSDAKISTGWEQEIPPHEYMNYIQNLMSSFLKHLSENGIAVWDSVTDYQLGAQAIGSDGVRYESLQTPNVNQDPTASPSYWRVAHAVGSYYVDSGAADAYVLTSANALTAPNKYNNGDRYLFRPSNINTGACTANIEGLGIKSIKTASGDDPNAGSLVENRLEELVYDQANDWLEKREFVSNLITTATITPDADANYTLTSDEYTADELELKDGLWSQGRTILIPAAAGNRRYFVDNSAGTYDAAIGISGGASVTVPATKSRVVLADGTDVTDPLSQATETSAGIVEKATAAEAQAFTADKYIDGERLASAFQGANQSLSANGYQVLPGGGIRQWGYASQPAPTATTSVTFPLAFPNDCLSVTISPDTTGGTGNTAAKIIAGGVSTTGFTADSATGSSTKTGLYWMAEGY